jgi:flavorubredoxin
MDDDRFDRTEKLAEQIAGHLAALERDVAVIRSNYATKEDLHKEINAQTWRLVTFVCGYGTALVAATYFIATHTR